VALLHALSDHAPSCAAVQRECGGAALPALLHIAQLGCPQHFASCAAVSGGRRAPQARRARGWFGWDFLM
jgi:hypothetical protein